MFVFCLLSTHAYLYYLHRKGHVVRIDSALIDIMYSFICVLEICCKCTCVNKLCVMSFHVMSCYATLRYVALRYGMPPYLNENYHTGETTVLFK